RAFPSQQRRLYREGPARPPAPVRGSALAVAAPDRGPLRQHGFLQRPAAARAGFAAAAVGGQFLLEIAGRAVGREEVAQGGAAAADGAPEDALDRVREQAV